MSTKPKNPDPPRRNSDKHPDDTLSGDGVHDDTTRPGTDRSAAIERALSFSEALRNKKRPPDSSGGNNRA